MRCYHATDPKTGEKVLIPGCEGTTYRGIEYCTCENLPQTFKEFERKEFNEMIQGKNEIIREQQKEIVRLNRILRKVLRK